MRPLLERAIELEGRVKSPSGGTPTYPDGLTRREVEVLLLVAGGRSNRKIAEILFISPSTVIHHLSNIFVKTPSANRAEAATYAAHHGISAQATNPTDPGAYRVGDSK